MREKLRETQHERGVRGCSAGIGRCSRSWCSSERRSVASWGHRGDRDGMRRAAIVHFFVETTGYFYSSLNENGRAGFVMSSQASSASHGEKDVRRKIVESGDVDVMISIRSNFFYTRSVPCELWFFDRGKPEHLRDK